MILEPSMIGESVDLFTTLIKILFTTLLKILSERYFFSYFKYFVFNNLLSVLLTISIHAGLLTVFFSKYINKFQNSFRCSSSYNRFFLLVPQWTVIKKRHQYHLIFQENPNDTENENIK